MSRPSWWRTLGVLLRMSLRRRLNQLASGQMGLGAQIRALGSQARQPTPRKGAGGATVLLWIFAPLLFLMSLLLSSMVLGQLGRQFDHSPWRVSEWTPELLREVDRTTREAGRLQSRERLIRDALLQDFQVRGLPEEERVRLIEHVVQRALAGQPLDVKVKTNSLMSDRNDWPDTGRRRPLVRLLSSLFLLIAVVLVLTALASRGDLARLGAAETWLAGLPVTARLLLGVRFVERLVLSAATWLLVLPLTVSLLVCAGWGGFTVPAALLATVSFMAMVGAVVIACETWMGLHLRPNVLKNVQAVLTVMAVLPTMLMYTVGAWVDRASSWLARVPVLPAWANPFGLLANLALDGPSPGPLLLLAGASTALCAVALYAAGWMLRGGLAVGAGPYQGTRRGASPPPTRLGLGVLRKDALLLKRDKAFMMRTLVLPLLSILFQGFYFGSVFREEFTFDRAAAVCFLVAAYVSFEPGVNTLAMEGGAVWLLFTGSRRLSSLFLQKGVLWAFVALGYAGVGLTASAWLVPAAPLPAAGAAATALAGTVVFAFGAQAVGLLSFDPNATDPMRASVTLSRLVLPYCLAVFAQSIWIGDGRLRLAQLLVATLTVLAVWQRVEERLPYLLDPVDEPPAGVGALDGLLAAFGCLTLQPALSWAFHLMGSSRITAASIGFLLSAGIVLCLSMWSYSRRGVDIVATLGLEAPADRWPAVLGWGVAGGCITFAVLSVYLWAVGKTPWLAPFLDVPNALRDNTLLVIVAVVAAPLLEEYVFRGLLYGGLRRALPAGWAALASAGLFAIIHPTLAVVPVFVLGLAAALVYRHTRVLWSAVATHAVYNLLVVATA